MLQMLLLTACALLVVGGFALPSRLSPPSESEWGLFKQTYMKVYDPLEEVTRQKIWKSNFDRIRQHNLEYRAGKHTYTLGVNAYTDMTNAEFVEVMNCFRMDYKTPLSEKSIFQPPYHVIDLPTSVDWRKKGYVTPVKHQKRCGSCWAFSATGSLEGQHFKKNGTLVSLSEQNLVDCSTPEGNHGCKGGSMDRAFEYATRNGGIDTEISYPYVGRDGKCHFKPGHVGTTCSGYVDVKRFSEKDLQMAVATVGPISVAIDASHPSFHLYKSGVYNEQNCSSTKLDHGVLVVGYGVQGSHDYWLVKNSWGTTWGMKGYIMMSRNKNNQCGIATRASYPKV